MIKYGVGLDELEERILYQLRRHTITVEEALQKLRKYGIEMTKEELQNEADGL